MSVLKTALHGALVVLTGHENAKIRLTRAWLEHLAELSPDKMPDGFREKFLALRDRLTSERPINREHPAVAAIRKMAPAEAARHGQDIVQMFIVLLSEDAPVQLRLVESAEAEEVTEVAEPVPDFLTRH